MTRGRSRLAGIAGLAGVALALLAACGSAGPGPGHPAPTPVPLAARAPEAPVAVQPVVAVLPPAAGPTAAPVVASADDTALLQEALAGSGALKSYHFRLVATGDSLAAPLYWDGDFVAPDAAYSTARLGGETFEHLSGGGQTFGRSAGGAWAAQPADAPLVLGLRAGALFTAPNVLAAWTALAGDGDALRPVGDEVLDGVPARHFAGSLAGGPASGPDTGDGRPGGTLEIWADPATSAVLRVRASLDLAPASSGMGGGLPALARPPLAVDLQISQQDDPGISVPTGPVELWPTTP